MWALRRLLSYNQLMRRFFHKLRASLCNVTVFLAATLLLASVYRDGNAIGQVQQPPQFPQGPPQSGVHLPLGDEGETGQDPNLRRAQLEAARKRNVERQNKLVADSGKILLLAQELSADVEPGGKDPAPSELAKKAEEIEKLARSVKDHMKSE